MQLNVTALLEVTVPLQTDVTCNVTHTTFKLLCYTTRDATDIAIVEITHTMV